jgi:hypothetical protein
MLALSNLCFKPGILNLRPSDVFSVARTHFFILRTSMMQNSYLLSDNTLC